MGLFKTENEKKWAQKLSILKDFPCLWAINQHWHDEYPDITVHSVNDRSPYYMELIQLLRSKDAEQFQFWVYLEEHQGQAIEKITVKPGQYPWEPIAEFHGYQSKGVLPDGYVRISAIVVAEKKTADWLSWETITVYRMPRDSNYFGDFMFSVRR